VAAKQIPKCPSVAPKHDQVHPNHCSELAAANSSQVEVDDTV
jgi:hypothetical protein